MYYIYHIPNVKIGCSKNPTKRVLQQGYTNYEVLEVYKDIKLASERELSLQKKFGYSVDTCSYIDSIKNMPKGKQHLGGSASSLKKWKNNREQMLVQCKKAGEICKEKFSKKTLMCDLEGNIIKEFSSRREAADYVNGNKPNVILACNEPHRTYKGYKWKNG